MIVCCGIEESTCLEELQMERAEMATFTSTMVASMPITNQAHLATSCVAMNRSTGLVSGRTGPSLTTTSTGMTRRPPAQRWSSRVSSIASSTDSTRRVRAVSSALRKIKCCIPSWRTCRGRPRAPLTRQKRKSRTCPRS